MARQGCVLCRATSELLSPGAPGPLEALFERLAQDLGTPHLGFSDKVLLYSSLRAVTPPEEPKATGMSQIANVNWKDRANDLKTVVLMGRSWCHWHPGTFRV